MKTAIVTDSTAYIPEQLREEHHIYMLPLMVHLGEESFREEIDISAEEFYEKASQLDVFPSSSQPSLGATIELFKRLSKEYDAIIAIYLSSGISGAYQSAYTLKDEFPLCPIYPFDSEISCYPQARLVLEAARLAHEGIEPERIVTQLVELRERTKAYFMVDDLTNLQKGGRLSGGAALVGSMLKIKPILHFENKEILVFEKIRTKKKALQRIRKLLAIDIKKVDYPLVITVIHANREAAAKEIADKIQHDYPHLRVEISYFGPVIGTHLGEGAIGISWTEDVEINKLSV